MNQNLGTTKPVNSALTDQICSQVSDIEIDLDNFLLMYNVQIFYLLLFFSNILIVVCSLTLIIYIDFLETFTFLMLDYNNIKNLELMITKDSIFLWVLILMNCFKFMNIDITEINMSSLCYIKSDNAIEWKSIYSIILLKIAYDLLE